MLIKVCTSDSFLALYRKKCNNQIPCYTTPMKMRIQKYLSEQKILSRREAKEYIIHGLIKLNGKVCRETGAQMDPEKDKITILTPPKSMTENKMTVLVYKPRGIVCSKVEEEGKTIFELLPEFKDLNTVGRLDKSSEGLILLSNEGPVTSAVTSDKHLIEKEYEVSTREDVVPAQMEKMTKGILLEDGMTLPAQAKKTGQNRFKIILKEGRKHQIRRMANAVNLTITSLKRVRIGNIKLKGLRPSQFRKLSPEELANLKK